MVQDDKSVGPDGVNVVFDDERVVSDAGVMLVATLARRLGRDLLSSEGWARWIRVRATNGLARYCLLISSG